MDDFNAKVGNGRFEDCIGPFGVEKRNDNIFLKLPARNCIHGNHLKTRQIIVRIQIDYIMINKRLSNSTSVKTYSGAGIKSVHNLLLGTIKLN